MGLTIELAYPSHVTTSTTHCPIFCSQSPHTVGTKFSTKNGAHSMTNVKNTTPSTFVAFCSSRMIRPCRDEFRDITLEFREWCDRTVPHRVKHGVDLLVFARPLTLSIFDTELSMLRADVMPLMSRFWLRRVAERRSDGVIWGNLLLVSNEVWWLVLKAEPRRDFWLRRVSLQSRKTTIQMRKN